MDIKLRAWREDHIQEKSTVSFEQMYSPGNRAELKLFNIISIESMRNTDRSQELYFSNGDEYSFPIHKSSCQSR